MIHTILIILSIISICMLTYIIHILNTNTKKEHYAGNIELAGLNGYSSEYNCVDSAPPFRDWCMMA
jgi:hypothetical protein